MQYIAQQTFLKQFLEVGTLLTFSAQFSSANDDKEAFFEKIVKANYQEVTKLIIALEPEITEIRRRLVFDFTNLSAALAELISRFYQKDALVTYIQYFLIKYQKTDGTLDLENLASQPDTAFILEPICAAALILRKLTMPALSEVKVLLKDSISKSGEAIRSGGVHTPNQHQVISATLARINNLYPDKKYVNRIDKWLSENIV